MARGTVLIVEDDEGFADTVVAPRFERGWKVEIAYTRYQAQQFLERGEPMAAAIVDLDLPDGSGLDLVGVIRARNAAAVVVLLTAYWVPELVNKTHALGVEYVLKEGCGENLVAVARRLATADHVAHERLHHAVAALATARELTAREAEVVALVAADVPREELPKRLGIGIETLKSHTRSILRKCGARTLAELGRSLRRGPDGAS